MELLHFLELPPFLELPMSIIKVSNNSFSKFAIYRHKFQGKRSCLKIMSAAMALVMLNGCSTIIDGETQAVTIATYGANGAQCQILDSRGRQYTVPSTPGQIVLRKNSGDLDITCQKSGFPTARHHVDANLSIYTLVGFAGIIPGVVDLALGNQFTYDDTIIVSLAPGAGAVEGAANQGDDATDNAETSSNAANGGPAGLAVTSNNAQTSPPFRTGPVASNFTPQLQANASEPLNYAAAPPYFSADTETSPAETGLNIHSAVNADELYASYAQQQITPVSPAVQGTLRPDETANGGTQDGQQQGLTTTAPAATPAPAASPAQAQTSSNNNLGQAQSAGKYSLQAGAYSNQASAQKVINEYQSKGYGAWIFKGRRLNYVRIGNFKSLDEAKASADYFKNAEGTDVIIVAN